MRSVALLLLAGTVVFAFPSHQAMTQELLPSEAAPPVELDPAVTVPELPDFESLPAHSDLPFVDAAEPVGVVTPELQEPLPATLPDTLEQLRQKFVLLQQRKAQLMGERELQAALQATDTEILRLQADRKLAETLQMLEGLAAEYPDTPAAHTAMKMLQAGQKPLTPRSDVPIAPAFDRPDERDAQFFYRSEGDAIPAPRPANKVFRKPIKESDQFDEAKFDSRS